MSDDDARERARRRLEERQARMRAEGHPSRARAERANGSRLQGVRASDARTSSAPPWESAIDALVAAARAIGPKRIAIALAAAALLVALVVGIRGCLAAGENAPDAQGEAEAPSEQQEPREPIDEAALSAILGEDLSARLVQAAAADDDVAWIAAHPDAYAVDGEAVQFKLLKLAATEPEAVPFVRGFPDAYPSEGAQPTGDPEPGAVPRLYQWDPRWGSTVYSSTTFALTGCCPTALSMVYQGLTGSGDLSPYDLGVRAREGGYETTFDGTDQAFLVNEAASLGLSCEEVPLDAGGVRAALEDGALLVCNVGPGDFTDNGHFFVVTGLDADGNLVVNDPYSAERSNRPWGVEEVLAQTKALWAYRLA